MSVQSIAEIISPAGETDIAYQPTAAHVAMGALEQVLLRRHPACIGLSPAEVLLMAAADGRLDARGVSRQ